MPKPPDSWPKGVRPRCMDAASAAYYVGLSASTFLQRVKEGKYPAPRHDGRRTIWDCAELDAAVDRLHGHSAKIGSSVEIDAAEEDEAVAVMRRRRAGGNRG